MQHEITSIVGRRPRPRFTTASRMVDVVRRYPISTLIVVNVLLTVAGVDGVPR